MGPRGDRTGYTEDVAKLRSPGPDAPGPGPESPGAPRAGDQAAPIARLLQGALVRGSMLIAGPAGPAATRENAGRAVRAGFARGPGE